MNLSFIKVILFLFFLNCLVLDAQNNYKLSGKVIDCKTQKGIVNASMKLYSSKGEIISTTSDSFGIYHFYDTILKSNLAYVISANAPPSHLDSITPFGKCPYSYCVSFPKTYLKNSEKSKFKTDDSLIYKTYTFDFCFSEYYKCDWRLPTIYFKKNSTDFGAENLDYSSYETEPDTAIDCIVDFIASNPNFVIEINGHADKKEKNPKQLSELRAKKVYDYCIKNGIDMDRIFINAQGANMPKEYIDENNGALRKRTGQINQRVSISLLRKDYNPLTK